MSRIIEMQPGQMFGRWTLKGKAPKSDDKTRWEVECECGVVKYVPGYVLRAGKSTQCQVCAYLERRVKGVQARALISSGPLKHYTIPVGPRDWRELP